MIMVLAIAAQTRKKAKVVSIIVAPHLSYSLAYEWSLDLLNEI